PPVQLGVALLATEALDLGHGDSRHARLGEGFPHLVELERPDDGSDQFHVRIPMVEVPAWRPAFGTRSGRTRGPGAPRTTWPLHDGGGAPIHGLHPTSLGGGVQARRIPLLPL